MTGTAAEITPVRQVDLRRGQRPPGRADAQSPEALWRRRAAGRVMRSMLTPFEV